MIKKTLYFGSASYLSTQNEQLVITIKSTGDIHSIPMEDISTIELDHSAITITKSALHKCSENGIAVVVCDSSHLPSGIMLPFENHSVHTERQRVQHNMKLPLKKRLWQETVRGKILNQALLLQKLNNPVATTLFDISKKVKSGDSDNREAVAALQYWKSIFPNFKRERFGEYPNNILNYGYSILRAIVARGIVSTGLHPSIGIFHKNRYNPFCLADDIMEPYRPFVDEKVAEYVATMQPTEELTPDVKKFMLAVTTTDVLWCDEKRPLMIAVQLTCSSLYKCLAEDEDKLLYPVFLI